MKKKKRNHFNKKRRKPGTNSAHMNRNRVFSNANRFGQMATNARLLQPSAESARAEGYDGTFGRHAKTVSGGGISSATHKRAFITLGRYLFGFLRSQQPRKERDSAEIECGPTGFRTFKNSSSR